AWLGLAEPYRSAAILRHLDGLSNGEIAARQGCSVEAARQRVARGLAELRDRLAREYGNRASWCAALARLVRPGFGSTAVAAGGIVVGAKIVAGWRGGGAEDTGAWGGGGGRDGATERDARARARRRARRSSPNRMRPRRRPRARRPLRRAPRSPRTASIARRWMRRARRRGCADS